MSQFDRLQTGYSQGQAQQVRQPLLQNPSHQSLSHIGQQIMTPNPKSASNLTEHQHAFGLQPRTELTQKYMLSNPVGQNADTRDPNEYQNKMDKRSRAQQLQQEQLAQIEERKRREQAERDEEKRQERILNDKIKRDREELERNIMNNMDYQIRKENKNLNESLDPAIERELREKKLRMSQKMNENVQPVMYDDSGPPEFDEQAEELARQRERLLLQQQMIRQIPIEVNNQIQSTINSELLKLKNEIGYQQNHLGEQMLNLRGAIINTNQEKQKIQGDIDRLKSDIKKTQYLDEIRQREIYNAFVVKHQPNYYISNTEKLIEPEAQVFIPPKRPKPYYNRGDPYIEGFNTKHNHVALDNETAHMPFGQAKRCGQENYLDDILFEKEKVNPIHENHQRDYFKDNVYGHIDRDGINLQNHIPNSTIPDDHKNRQNLVIPKETDVDIQHILVKNQNRIDALDEVIDNDQDPRNRIDELDQALFHNLLKKNDEMAYNLGPKEDIKLHYRYKSDHYDSKDGYSGHSLDMYDNNRSKAYPYNDI